jgi:hypothetical protein
MLNSNSVYLRPPNTKTTVPPQFYCNTFRYDNNYLGLKTPTTLDSSSSLLFLAQYQQISMTLASLQASRKQGEQMVILDPIEDADVPGCCPTKQIIIWKRLGLCMSVYRIAVLYQLKVVFRNTQTYAHSLLGNRTNIIALRYRDSIPVPMLLALEPMLLGKNHMSYGDKSA